MSTEVATSTSSLRLKCMEIWGGNQATDEAIEVAGINAWVFSEPYGGEAAGGDIYFVSTCGAGEIARFALADVAGHGSAASQMAVTLRRLMRKHINRVDQTRFARSLNKEYGDLAKLDTFATALLASYYGPTDHLVVCNAGHPPPLWYRSRTRTWQPLTHGEGDHSSPGLNFPLGIIEPTNYVQFAVQLDIGDLVLIYSDAVIEASSPDGVMLGGEGFLELVRQVETSDPESVCHTLLDKLSLYRGGAAADDDVTLIMLHHNGSESPKQSLGELVRVMGKMWGVVKV